MDAFYGVLGRYSLADLVADRGALEVILHRAPGAA
jgi:hypothetical protein